MAAILQQGIGSQDQGALFVEQNSQAEVHPTSIPSWSHVCGRMSAWNYECPCTFSIALVNACGLSKYQLHEASSFGMQMQAYWHGKSKDLHGTLCKQDSLSCIAIYCQAQCS